jgi:Spy/CpxP family protein refolding chaperone
MILPTRMRVVVLAAVCAASTAFAADLEALKNTTPAERARMQTAMMKNKLRLTEAQVPRVAAINEKYAAKMEPILKGSSGPLERMRDARALQQEKEGDLKKVLSPEQFEKFLASKQEMREQFVHRLREQGTPGGSAR